MRQMKVILAGAAMASIALTASADTLATWDFSGLDYQGGTPPEAINEAVVTGSILAAADGNALAGSSVTDLTGDGTALKYSNLSNTAAGEADLKNWGSGGYMEFTLTADAGQALNIASMSISEWRNGGGAPSDMRFEVSVDGGAYALYAPVQTDPDSGSVSFDTFTFTAAITGADSVGVRFNPTLSTGNLHINGLDVTGTITAIPEPATMGMVALFGGGILFIRRRLMM